MAARCPTLSYACCWIGCAYRATPAAQSSLLLMDGSRTAQQPAVQSSLLLMDGSRTAQQPAVQPSLPLMDRVRVRAPDPSTQK
ncbi:hypothetical protein [Dictyobacter halimunensis]|uniref:hypothetical protein n=1 Tax=Dictyobacter halimunensis TaxID=3026934 RepID=UPI0030C7656D